jgi:hypothetical protein
VIVHNRYVFGSGGSPAKTDPPPLIDANPQGDDFDVPTLRKRRKDCAARLRCVGRRALATKYHRGVGLRTKVPGESNDSTSVTIAHVPARMATAFARPGGGSTKGSIERHDRRLASRTLFRRGMGFSLASKGASRNDGSRNTAEVRITLLEAIDGRSLVTTVVSRAAKSLYQSRQHLKQSIDIGSRSLVTGPNGVFLLCDWSLSIHNAMTVLIALFS